MAISKTDLYKVHLKHREAYLLFLAAEETDTTVLPAPLTAAEQVLYNDCVTAATALAEAAAAAEAAGSGGSDAGSGTSG